MNQSTQAARNYILLQMIEHVDTTSMSVQNILHREENDEKTINMGIFFRDTLTKHHEQQFDML